MTRVLRDGQDASGARENLLFQGVEWALCKTHLMLPSRARLPAKLPPVLLDSVAIPPCIGVPLIQPGLCCFWHRDENLTVDAAPNTPQADVVEREREREREEREREEREREKRERERDEFVGFACDIMQFVDSPSLSLSLSLSL